MTGSHKALALSFLAAVAAALWYHLLVFQAAGGTTPHFGVFILWLFPYLPLSARLLSGPEGLDGFLEFVVPVIQIIAYWSVIHRAWRFGRLLRAAISLAVVHLLALVAAVVVLYLFTPWH